MFPTETERTVWQYEYDYKVDYLRHSLCKKNRVYFLVLNNSNSNPELSLKLLTNSNLYNFLKKKGVVRNANILSQEYACVVSWPSALQFLNIFYVPVSPPYPQSKLGRRLCKVQRYEWSV